MDNVEPYQVNSPSTKKTLLMQVKEVIFKNKSDVRG